MLIELLPGQAPSTIRFLNACSAEVSLRYQIPCQHTAPAHATWNRVRWYPEFLVKPLGTFEFCPGDDISLNKTVGLCTTHSALASACDASAEEFGRELGDGEYGNDTVLISTETALFDLSTIDSRM